MDQVTCVVLAPDGDSWLLYFSMGDNSIFTCTPARSVLQSGAVEYSCNECLCWKVLGPRAGGVTCLVNAGSRTIVAGTTSGQLEFLPMQGTWTEHGHGHQSNVGHHAVTCLCNVGRGQVASGAHSTIRIWDVASRTCVQEVATRGEVSVVTALDQHSCRRLWERRSMGALIVQAKVCAKLCSCGRATPRDRVGCLWARLASLPESLQSLTLHLLAEDLKCVVSSSGSMMEVWTNF